MFIIVAAGYIVGHGTNWTPSREIVNADFLKASLDLDSGIESESAVSEADILTTWPTNQ